MLSYNLQLFDLLRYLKLRHKLLSKEIKTAALLLAGHFSGTSLKLRPQTKNRVQRVKVSKEPEKGESALPRQNALEFQNAF